jgi:pheromone alpha factor receptor
MSSPDPNNATWAAIVASQTFNLTAIDGESYTFNLSDFDTVAWSYGQSLVILGTDIGMCAVLGIVLLLLTKPEKRRTRIFILNIAGLALQFVRMLLAAIQYNGINSGMAVQLLGTITLSPMSSFIPAFIYMIVTMFWYMAIITSIILQVRVVFGTERTTRKFLTFGLGLLGFAAVAFNITTQSDDFKGYLKKTGETDPWKPWVELTGRILYTVTIGLSSAIFVAKLLYLIHRRKKLGFRGFGPLQVIVIMASQCLLIPRTSPSHICSLIILVAFTISDFYVNLDGFVTIGETFLTCSLPLSALWASSEAENASTPQIKAPSAFGTTSDAGTEVRPHSKKSFFSFWNGGRGTQTSSVHSDMEKGSFSEESDHVMVQKTLQVIHSDSPAPRSTTGNYKF